jgi:hypothetical protein
LINGLRHTIALVYAVIKECPKLLTLEGVLGAIPKDYLTPNYLEMDRG